MPAILFVCTANQCRSPAAAALFKRRIERLPNAATWRVESAGTWVVPGRPAHRSMQLAAQTFGLDLSHHRAQPIEAPLTLAAFDLILTMERGQKEALQTEQPQIRERIHLLSALAGAPYDIPDPIGGAPQRYLDTLHEIERLLQAAWPKLLQLLARTVKTPAPAL